MLFPTTLVGSFPQPEWLIDRDKLLSSLPPRVRMTELWRVTSPLLALSAGRCHDPRHPGAGRMASTSSPTARSAARVIPIALPRRWTASKSTIRLPCLDAAAVRISCLASSDRSAADMPWKLNDVKFLRAHTTKAIKLTVPGPFTMTQQAHNEYYPSEEAAALAYAAVVNEEIRDLFAAGADIVQVDEPYMQAQPDKARAYGLKALNRALEGISGETAVHICFGYAAIVHQRPSGYSFLPELAGCSARKSPSRPRNRSSTARSSRSWPARRSWSAVSTSTT